ncbi:pseudouridylate synthase [Acidianus sp. HS-5]|uniref:pseudouridylate synthase n=1 Tax=Acidianus sp. HS-5 TaxID=2886040 RepID=UPI001F4006C5|nr:pseudouridylate synthase [Acidianus sp. HS-5]BDC19945.1 pseudouridylate synthase [Acidianus sp. HS-5]
MSKSSLDNLEEKALELLKKYPLCDSCLGRCFAKLGYRFENKERGKAIKTYLTLELDRRIKDHELEDLNEIKELLFNMGEDYSGIFEIYFSGEKFQERSCYICNSEIEEIKEDFFKKALDFLKKQGKVKYVLGVKLSEQISRIENEFVFTNGLIYYESIRNEIKREVGKMLAKEGYEPCMDRPDVVIIYDLGTRSIYTISKKYKTLYLYSRLSRRIPISSWYAKDSLEEEFSGKEILVPFTEPSEVRILDEYPIIISDEDRDKIEVKGYFLRKVGKIAGREISSIMTSRPEKRIYSVLLYSKEEIGENVLNNIRLLTIEARDFKELKEKLESIHGEIISIDLIQSEGKHKILENKVTL